jgi:alpha-tubulin suppressor-like RCC1 family protein
VVVVRRASIIGAALLAALPALLAASPAAAERVGPFVSGFGTCVLEDGVPSCWGIGSEMTWSVPKGIVAMDIADAHACGLDAKGSVHCWGARYGDEGDIPYEVEIPANLPPGSAIAIGEAHRCVIAKKDGAVWCWGANDDGQCDGTRSRGRRDAVEVPGVADAVELALGSWSSCARTRSGKVFCWGRPKPNEITDDDVKVRAMAVKPSAQLVADGELACSRSTKNAIECWGARASSLAPDADDTTVNALVRPKAPANTEEIAVANGSVCARTSAGTVACAGDFADSFAHAEQKPGTFVAVGGVTDAVAVGAGGGGGCVRRTDGRIACWGERERFGTTYGDAVTVPVAVRGLTDAVAIDSDESTTCVIDKRADVWCWGNRHDLAEPVKAAGLAGATRISVARDGVCAVVDGGIRCRALDRHTPRGLDAPKLKKKKDGTVEVPLAAKATAVALAPYHACAVAGGSLACWGTAYRGETGKPASANAPASAPAIVGGFDDATAVAVTANLTCAIAGGSVRCLGAGDSDRFGAGPGDGAFAGDSTPRTVVHIDNAVEVSLGGKLACARRADGTAACWGSEALTPIDWRARTAIGDAGPCIARADGAVECGLPGLASQVPGIDDATAVAVGAHHACALRTSGAVACWGERRYGALGDGVADFFTTAVDIALP